MILLSLIYLIPYAFTYSPKSCASCHSMKKYYSSWKESTHEVAASHCTVCHIKPGFINNFLFKLVFWKEIYAEITGREINPSRVFLPSVNSCNKAGCHSLNRISDRSGEIKIKHREHIVRAKLKCDDCHPGAVHTGVTGEPLPMRKLCTKCHKERMDDCSFCHLKKFPHMKEFKH